MKPEATQTDLDEMRGVAINVGEQTRRLILDFNALARIEEVTGENMLAFDDWACPPVRVLRAGIWAGLLHAEPKLRLSEVGSWLNSKAAIDEAMLALVRARNAAFPKAQEGEGAGSPENPPVSESRG